MKRNKKAFTLAEVSIAMAVIGIVATLILPLVVKNVQKLQTGPMLGRILEQIETGNQNIINLANSKYVATTLIKTYYYFFVQILFLDFPNHQTSRCL